MTGPHATWTDYYLDVAGQSFEVDSTAYLAAPDVTPWVGTKPRTPGWSATS